MMKTFALVIMLFSFSNTYSQTCDGTSFSNRTENVLPRCNLSDGSITILSSSGGVEPYNYILNGEPSFIGAYFNLPVGIYQLITIDGRRCRDTSYIDFNYKELNTLVKPDNAFTPNGDAINDTWYIRGIESFKAAKVNVFNRWGQLVHSNSPYLNKSGWDGTLNGQEATEGTYYYVITIANSCINDQLKGSVSIIR